MQGEPAVPATQVDDAHAGHDAGVGDHPGRVCPKRFPPRMVGHPGSFKEARGYRPTTFFIAQGLTASNEMLFTPNFLLAPFALSEMNWYCGLSSTLTSRSPTASIMWR